MTISYILHINIKKALKQAKVCSLLLPMLVASCATSPTLPTNSTPTTEVAQIYPDYRNVIIPPNIAPLNFKVNSPADEYVASIEGSNHQVLASAGNDGVLQFDSIEWKDMLAAARGKNLNVTIYAQRGGNWIKFPSYHLSVAQENIDPYLSYRLIEPSYELYRQMGLYQRNLENFNVQTIYENNRTYTKDNHCVNCHNYQNYSTHRMLFHVRAAHGGTVFVEDGKAEKRTIKSDSILAGATYPTWHPTRNWVVFSSNKTGQTFHISNHQKIEVVDYASDLIFYDVDKGQVRNILKTDYDLENFPCWSPDGKRLFYTCAHTPDVAGQTDSMRIVFIKKNYDKLHYNIMSMSFNDATQKFGTPQVEVDCDAMQKSASVPRISPDGRYVLFTLADYGQFHIWHKSADLWVKDLLLNKIYPLTATNSKDVDSYHTWSSNGRWIVFSSRRNDGSYTRPYIAYFDKNGQGHKAFLLPQRDPMQNIWLNKSYNVPELTKDAVNAKDLKEVIYK